MLLKKLMGYDNDSTEKADIYYFNEATNKWKSKKGEMNSETNEISLTVSHFSNYGVFSEIDQQEKPKDKEDPPAPETPADEDENGDDSHVIIEDGNDDDNGTIIEDEKNQDIKEAEVLLSTSTNHYNMLLVGVLFIGLATIIL